MRFGMGELTLAGKHTLVTGASSGIGREIARLVAREGGHLVIVARRGERLSALRDELQGAFGVEVVCIEADLSSREGVLRAASLATEGRTISAAVLCAGVSFFGSALRQPLDDLEQMIAANVTSAVYLSQHIAKHMIAERTEGGLLLVSSLAGLSPATWLASYSGTKAFLTNFGLALGEELAEERISVTVFAPGGVLTEMGQRSGTARKFKRGSPAMMEADVCARSALRALQERRRFVVPGLLSQIVALLLRFVPRPLAASLSGRLYRGALVRVAYAP